MIPFGWMNGTGGVGYGARGTGIACRYISNCFNGDESSKEKNCKLETR